MDDITLLKKKSNPSDNTEIKASELLAFLLPLLLSNIEVNNNTIEELKSSLLYNVDTIVDDKLIEIKNIIESNKINLDNFVNKDDLQYIVERIPNINKDDLQYIIEMIPDITKDDLQYIIEMIPDLTKDSIEKVMTIDEVYELKHPINITSMLNENDITKIGVMYYNPIMEKLRLRTSHGWQSVKLE